MVWSAFSLTCVCDANSVPVNQTDCAACTAIFGSTGAKAGTTACGCLPGWAWSSTLKACACANRACSCPANRVLNPSNVCVACSGIVGSTGVALSSLVCECRDSNVWNSAAAQCDCPPGAVQSLDKTICRLCNILINAVTRLTPTTCLCMANYAWSNTTLSCVYVYTANVILLPNGTKTTCSRLVRAAAVSVDNFNCRCAAGSVWRDFTFECVLCSSIANTDRSGAVTSSPVACICLAGYRWDILSFSCKPNSCTDTVCTYCDSRMPGLSPSPSALQLIAPGEPTIQFSGDVQFAAQASADSAMYASYASYKCVCIAGYLWSVPRRRCFISTASATY